MMEDVSFYASNYMCLFIGFHIKNVVHKLRMVLKYDKQDHQGKAAFNKRSPHLTQ
jgi:hypothetical protein